MLFWDIRHIEVTAGQVIFDGEDLLELDPDERSRAGLFLAFQYPVAIPGVTLANFLRQAINARLKAKDPDSKGIPIPEFPPLAAVQNGLFADGSQFCWTLSERRISAAARKNAPKYCKWLMLEPRIAILDETDSGLDIDALRIVAEGVNKLRGPDLGVLVITHYQRILNYIAPEYVHVMFEGKIVESGGPELALHLEEAGYDWIREKYSPA